MVRKFGAYLSAVTILLILISPSSLALNETEMERIKEILPYWFPVNNETKIKIKNGTIWVETPIDPNNLTFPDPDEIVSKYTNSKKMDELSRELEESQEELEKAMKNLEKLEEDMKKIEETRQAIKRSLIIALISLMILLTGAAIKYLQSKER